MTKRHAPPRLNRNVACITVSDGAAVIRREVHTVPNVDPEWRAFYLAFIAAAQINPRHVIFYSDLEPLVVVEKRRSGPVRKGEKHWLYLQTLLQAFGTYWPGNSAPPWKLESAFAAHNSDGTWQTKRVAAESLTKARSMADEVQLAVRPHS